MRRASRRWWWLLLVPAVLLGIVAGLLLARYFGFGSALLVRNFKTAGGYAIPAGRRAILDEEPIHIFHTVCAWGVDPNDYGFHGLLAMKSILMARASGASKRRRYHFHVAVDAHMRDAIANPTEWKEIADVLGYAANHTDHRVEVSWYPVEDVQADAVAAVGSASAAAVPLNLFKDCSALRLKLPFMSALGLAGVDRLLYIDFDAVVKCDIEMMWEETLGDDWQPGQLIAVAEEGPHPMYNTVYLRNAAWPAERKKLATSAQFATGFNAGIMAIRLDHWRAVLDTYWPVVVDIVLAKGFLKWNESSHNGEGLYFGDNDILNILSFYHPEWFRVLPLSYNWRNEV